MARKITEKMRKSYALMMSEYGRKGGANSRKNLTPERRTELARWAAAARWGKRK